MEKINFVNNSTPAIDDQTLNQMQTNIENAIEDINGEKYSNTKTYNVGDIVQYDSKLYKCTTAITTAGDFDATKWVQINIIDNYLAILEEEEITV